MATSINMPNFRTLTNDEIRYVLDNAPYCLLGVADYDGTNNVAYPYIVPMYYTYNYSNIDNKYVFRIYSNDQGKKIDFLDSDDNRACLEFNYPNSNGIMTVIVTGKATLTQQSNGIVRLTLSPYTSDTITGRKYYTRHH